MRNFIVRIYKRVKSEMPLFFKRLGALSTGLTVTTLGAMEHKDKLPEWTVPYLSNVLAIAVAVTIFCFFTKVKDLPGMDDDEDKNEEQAA